MLRAVSKASSSAATKVLIGLLVALAAMDAALIAGSLGWPTPDDAGVFHFAAAQILKGGTAYRDFADFNMPGTYWLHEAILRLAGPGDGAFRTFDLLCAALVAASLYLLCRPAGRIPAAIGAAFLVLMHLTFGYEAAGQRDFALLLPLLACAVFSVWGAENATRRDVAMVLAGAALGFACLLKPTAAAAFLLPFVTLGQARFRDVLSFAAGGLIVGALALIQLDRTGSLRPLLANWMEHAAAYSQFEAKSPAALARSVAAWSIRLSGFVLPAILVWKGAAHPRSRAALALVLFGLVHLIAQRKGYFYHLYPLVTAIVALGSLSLPRTRPLIMIGCAMLIGGYATFRAGSLLARGWPIPALLDGAPSTSAATSEMQAALARNFAPDARVQLLDSDAGGFLAMARAGMRQATPDAYWFLLLERPEIQQRFLARLRSAGPDGVLVTNTQWPLGRTFDGFDRWTDLKSFIDDAYVEIEPGHPSWRLYKRR